MPGRNFEELEQEVRSLREALDRVERQRANAWSGRLARRLARPRTRLALAIAVVAIPMAAYAVTVPNVFVNGTVADADEVNANFAALADALNAHEPDPSVHHAKTVDAAELTSGTLADARLSTNVSLLGPSVSTGELAFDPATQGELDAHAGAASAHHAKTLDAAELIAGTLADARLSANVSLLGPNISTGELAFDTATQAELDAHEAAPSAHHTRYADAEAITAVGPHTKHPNRILVAPSGGDFTSIQAAIDSVTPMASDPYLIDIAPGNYNEILTLKSHLHLRGASTSGTVITPSSGGSNHVTSTSLTGVELSRLTLLDSGPSRDRAISATASEIALRDVRIEGYSVEWIRATSASVLHVEHGAFSDPNFDHDRGIILQDSEGVVSASVLETVDCAIEAERSDLVLADSEVLSFQVCALGTVTPQRHVSVARSRLNSVVVSGNPIVELVGNRIDVKFGGLVSIDAPGGAVEVIGNWVRGGASDVVRVLDGDVSVLGNRIVGTGGQVNGINALAGTAVRVVGNSIDATDHAVADAGTGLILGNRIDAGDIVQSTGTVTLGNSVLGQPSVEGWVNRRDIQIESTDNAVVLEAGGSTITLAASGDVSIQAAGDLDLSGTNVTISATQELELNGAVELDANGGVINLN